MDISTNYGARQQTIGQRLMVGFDGLVLNDEVKYYIRELRVGGLILFSRNIESPQQVADLCGAAQTYAATHGQPPLLIGIDQEGGVVARLKPPFTQFPGNPFLHSLEDARIFAETTAEELKRIGININMAPVLDVADPEGDGVMRQRVFGADPQAVARMGITVIHHLQANGVLAVAKHFPGIGRTVLDSHQDLPDLDIERRRLMDSDLIPFQAAFSHPVAGVMLSHIRYLGLDPVWPASLSTIIARDLLRDELGYQGLVLTDDIDMGALAKHYPVSTIVTRCLDADIDIILICHPGPKIEAAATYMAQYLEASDRIAQSHSLAVDRIMAAKETVIRS